jgi:hypothetical protein
MPGPVTIDLLEPAASDGVSTVPLEKYVPGRNLNQQPKPHRRIAAYAGTTMGAAAADAMAAITNPRNALEGGIRRRAIDMLFPKDRLLRLDVPDVRGPEDFDRALSVVHDARVAGTISPNEARICQELVEHRYHGWLQARAGKGLG